MKLEEGGVGRSVLTESQDNKEYMDEMRGEERS